MVKQKSTLILVVFLSCASICFGKYSGGTGEPNDPYLIATAEDLNDIGNHVEDFNSHFIMVNDINLSEYTETQFNIIGQYPEIPFIGVFDGNNHTILNFSYSVNYGPNPEEVGLFRYVSGPNAVIKNLGMINSYIDQSSNSGTLVVKLEQGKVSNCFVENGYISWSDGSGGGLIYYNQGGIVENCSFSGLVSGYYAGGLVSYNTGIISRCSTNAICGGRFSGGLVSENYGNIRECFSIGEGYSPYGLGGLCEENYGTITDCYSSVYCEGIGLDSKYIGGLVAENYGMIENCFSTGTAWGWMYIGGLVGYNPLGTVLNCYSTGIVRLSYSYTGGLVGYGDANNVTASFWDVNTSGHPRSAGGTPKTTAEMKTKSTFTDSGWDFVDETVNGPNDVWRMCVDDVNYPLLSCQFIGGDFTCPDGVDFVDFAILGSAWLSNNIDPHWNPICDISEPKDNLIDELDLAVFCDNWLQGL
jgi:hypothetical protein